MTGKSTAYRVVIVDDHPVVRQGLVVLLGSEQGLDVAGKAIGIEDGLKLIERESPDAALIDLSLGHENGLDLIRMVRQSRPETRILVISMHEEALYAERCIRAGAHGYVSKCAAGGTLIAALRSVLEGGTYLSQEMSERLDRHRDAQGPRTPKELLSDREFEVFCLIGNGLKTAQIADRLGLSVKTIETYRDRIKAKLEIATAAELALRAAHHTLGDS